MNRILVFSLLILISTLTNKLLNAQCGIYAGCPDSDPTLTIDPPTFDADAQSIILNNVTFGGFECTSASYNSGIVVYIYHLLPDGSRMEQCGVIGIPPFNVVASVGLDFGQTSLCYEPLNIGSLIFEPGAGFEACDGAHLEVEAVLYATENITFDPNNTSVYSELAESEYYVVNLGNIEINISNEFPGQGQPLTTAKITDFNTNAEDSMNLPCGEDIELYLEGLSRIANCVPYADIASGLPSELSNEFFYRINGGEPIMVLDESTGATGGILTGPNSELDNVCYAGIITNESPYTLAFADLLPDVCDGTNIEFTLRTTDHFTNETVEDQFTVIYSGGTGCGPACAPPPPTGACPVVYLNDDNLPSLPDALCEGDLLSLCFDLLADEATFNPALVEFNYELTFDGVAAAVTLENSFSPGTQIDPNASGQICFETIIPEGPDACQPFEISLTIESVFYRDDATCASNNIGFALNLSVLPASEGDDLNSLVPLLGLAGFNPLTLTGYPNPNWTAEITQTPGCDGSTLGIVEVYASNGTLCETVTDLGTAGLDGECPANNAEFAEYIYAAFETFTVPDQNEMDSVVINPCAISVTVPVQTIECDGPAEPPEGCDDGDCNNGLETWDGCACVSGTPPDDTCPPTTDCSAITSWDPATCMCITVFVDLIPCDDDDDCTTDLLDQSTCECVFEPIPNCGQGCTNSCATNYDETATDDDGSCVFPSPDDGCDLTTDSFNEENCEITNTPNCLDGTTFNASNCACDTVPVPGCTEPCATNYNPDANENDGSCTLPDPDDGCDLTEDTLDENCMIVNTPNCDSESEFDETSCSCIPLGVPGCTNMCATNFNPLATDDDGSCMLPDPDDGCDFTEDTFNSETCEVENTPNCPEDTPLFDPSSCSCLPDTGCTDPCSPNFNPQANVDDGSCILPPGFDDECDITNDTIDGITCEIIHTPNCPEGTNFNAMECSCDTDCVPPAAGEIDCE